MSHTQIMQGGSRILSPTHCNYYCRCVHDSAIPGRAMGIKFLTCLVDLVHVGNESGETEMKLCNNGELVL